MRHWLTAIMVGSIGMLAPAAPEAATMTFANFFNEEEPGLAAGGPYTEDGITVNFNGLSWAGRNGILMTDGTGGTEPARLDFTMAVRFKPVSFLITPRQNSFAFGENGTWPEWRPYDNVLVRGWRDGDEVWRDAFSMREPPFDNGGTGAWTYRLPRIGFIDSLSIEVRRPEDLGIGVCHNAPCIQMNVGDVTLAPIPLPPAYLMLLAALAALPIMARRSDAA